MDYLSLHQLDLKKFFYMQIYTWCQNFLSNYIKFICCLDVALFTRYKPGNIFNCKHLTIFIFLHIMLNFLYDRKKKLGSYIGMKLLSSSIDTWFPCNNLSISLSLQNVITRFQTTKGNLIKIRSFTIYTLHHGMVYI